MSVYRYTTATPKRAVCSACGESERIWSDAQIGRWKRAHSVMCRASRLNETRNR